MNRALAVGRPGRDESRPYVDGRAPASRPVGQEGGKAATMTATRASGAADSPYFLESVDRVMKVLDCFTVESPELRLTDLSERLGMPKTQVLRIVSTLESGGYLTRDERSKRYRLGVRLFHLGTVVREQLDIRWIAQPYLRRLVEATQETAALFVPDPLGPICIDVVQSPKAMRVYAQLGGRMPWNAGTSPKVILAYLPAAEREGIL